ncbi:MAG: septal ring lytic transglycosylase RlpA family protein [Saprospiraceae bacterium]|nr:septal ring lytic transglycosylase RlpA family protein [Saprospiraceae bacterium]MCB0676018.1 septal ring lytic transglycosylase RlpA family protein [Saprospiraceae bacterium]MCB0680636.1 septal ring lytic transglycosylase RlpA family protein [Saprospiraceae bacterium]
MKTLLRVASLGCLLVVSLALKAQEYGLASFYSDKFHGKPTASGELYDMNKLTAAHKTLPYGTIIEVTRLDNKKSVRVRVNDRGPYISGRVVDVSKKAAERLDLVADGTARVKVEVVERMTEPETPSEPVTSTSPAAKKEENTKAAEPKKEEKVASASKTEAKPAQAETRTEAKPANPSPATPSRAGDAVPSAFELVTLQNYTPYGLYKIELRRPAKEGFGVQVASLSNYDNAMREVADLQGSWFDNVLLSIEPDGSGQAVYKIILGPFATRASAENYKKNLKKKNKREGFVVDLSTLSN